MWGIVHHVMFTIERDGPPACAPILTILSAIFVLCQTGSAQLHGTYTIGAGGNYSTIETAITALNTQGISGPVVFAIHSGVYMAPSSGYTLSQLPSMSAANSVTFRPHAGAIVTITGNSSTAIFNFNGGDYYVLDGSSTGNSADRNWKVINSSTSGRVIRFISGATHNIIRNMNLMGNSTGLATGGIILFNTSSSGGNSHNYILSNTLGDSAGIERSMVSIAMSGSSGANINQENVIDDNDIINYGRASDNGYGIYISTNNRLLKILRNRITMTTIMETPGNRYGIYIANSTSGYDTIARNRIWRLATGAATAEAYAIYVSSQGPAPLIVHHNMISLMSGTGMLAGIYTTSGDSLYAEHNTVSIGGSSSSGPSTSYNVYNSAGSATIYLRNNVLINLRGSTGVQTNRVLHNSGGAARIISDHNILFNHGSSTVLAYQAGVYYTSLAGYMAGTGRDTGSVSGPVSFADTENGDLHIDPRKPFMGESLGMPLAYTEDFDGNPPDILFPDIGADEGKFIGMGLNLLAPDGGEKIAVDDDLDIRFTANRAMSIHVDLSTDGGENWAIAAIRTTVKGENHVMLITPVQVTSRALIRIVNMGDEREADTSGSAFDLVRPVLHILAPNGGERLMPTDTVMVEWTAQLTTSTMRLWLEFSSNNGSTWIPVDSGIEAQNLPSTNSRRWIVPDTQTERGMLRIRIGRGVVSDFSDAPFTIPIKPDVTLLEPAGGGRIFAGDIIPIRWQSVATDYVRLEYSTDKGISWNRMVAGGIDVPAFVREYLWTVPDASSEDVLIRLASAEYPRFGYVTATPLTIIRPSVRLIEPNGGEHYEMGRPATVRWASTGVGRLSLEYSPDGGISWQAVMKGIDARAGSAVFTPVTAPTRTALLRLIDEDRTHIQDRSDAVFEILGARSIIVHTPTTGELLERGSIVMISWEAPHITGVTIQYSSNGGTTWQTQIANVAGAQGSYAWTVPSPVTASGRIRIVEVGGTAVGESGSFSVVDRAPQMVRLFAPNGGEVFTQHDEITIRWTSSSLERVGLFYSTDGGIHWISIRENIPAIYGQYPWRIGSAPGTSYRVKVEAPEGTQDASDGNFTVLPHAEPLLVLVYPNGGERLAVDSTIQVRWVAQNITGNVRLEYAIQGSQRWQPIATAAATDERYSWTVPHDTGTMLLRISTAGGGPLADVSDRAWNIYEPKWIVLQRPNGGEKWRMGDMEAIEWITPPAVTAVDIFCSIDGGSHWTPVAKGIASATGLNRRDWSVPSLSSMASGALMRIRSSSDTNVQDVSDTSFTIDRSLPAWVIGGDTTQMFPYLLGNVPNPVGNTTEVRWKQPHHGEVHMMLYGRDGRCISSYDLGCREAGRHHHLIDASALQSGPYMYELRIGTAILRGTMVVIH